MSKVAAINRHHRSRGFMLIEILIAAVVIGIGYFSIFHLQLASIGDNRNAVQRTQAIQLVTNYIDRMRANRGAAKVGAYRYSGGTPPTPACIATTGSGCNALELAEYDISDWYKIMNDSALSGILPNASAKVTFDNTLYTVELSWDSETIHSANSQNGTTTHTVSEVFYPGI